MGNYLVGDVNTNVVYTDCSILYYLISFFFFKATESEPGDMDLSGLPETAVDSEEDDDEEDIERASDPLMSRDIVRDCLEKDPMDRTDDDIGTAFAFHGSYTQYTNHTVR